MGVTGPRQVNIVGQVIATKMLGRIVPRTKIKMGPWPGCGSRCFLFPIFWTESGSTVFFVFFAPCRVFPEKLCGDWPSLIERHLGYDMTHSGTTRLRRDAQGPHHAIQPTFSNSLALMGTKAIQSLEFEVDMA
jgi:hypothetical protein